MSTAATLIEECRARDIRLWAEASRLHFDAPTGALDPALRAELVTHKAELLVYLAPPKAQPGGVPGAQPAQGEFAWEGKAVPRPAATQDETGPGSCFQAPSRTGPPPECASDPEARAEREAIQAEGTPFAQEPSLAPPSPHRVPPSPDARVWRCRTPNCSAGWWQAPGGIIRCQRCEGPPHVWWIVVRGDLADAPCVAPFQLRTADPPRWRIEPWTEVPIRCGPVGARRAIEPPEPQDPLWTQGPEEETFER